MSRKIKTLALPPESYDTTAAAMYLAQQLKAAGRADVAALLVKNELSARLEKKIKAAEHGGVVHRTGRENRIVSGRGKGIDR